MTKSIKLSANSLTKEAHQNMTTVHTTLTDILLFLCSVKYFLSIDHCSYQLLMPFTQPILYTTVLYEDIFFNCFRIRVGNK